MKHLARISVGTPKRAEQWQEIICSVAVAFNAIMGFFGGESPLGLYIEDKCDIPVPNDTTGGA